MTPTALTPDQQFVQDTLLEFARDPSKGRMINFSGYAGTGKSFTIARLRALFTEQGVDFALTATTNKAVSIYRDQEIPASTIHSFLRLKLTETFDKDLHRLAKYTRMTPWEMKADPAPRGSLGFDRREGPLVIVDESSMVTDELFEYMEESSYRFIMVGDKGQLPPVKGESPLSPVFSEHIPGISLTKIIRQAEDNPLITFAAKVRQVRDGGMFPPMEARVNASGDGIIHMTDGAAFEKIVLAHFMSEAYKANKDHCRALAFTNSVVCQLNLGIDSAISGITNSRPRVGDPYIANSALNDPLDKGRSVLCANNTALTVVGVCDSSKYGMPGYDVTVEYSNQKKNEKFENLKRTVFLVENRAAIKKPLDDLYKDAGRASGIEKQEARKSGVSALGPEHPLRKARVRAYDAYYVMEATFADIRPVHASTVHKSQGSTYDVVFIDLNNICGFPRMALEDIASLLYTAVTRPRTRAYVYGEYSHKVLQYNASILAEMSKVFL